MAGTDDLIGATIIRVEGGSYDCLTAVKDGIQYQVSIEEDWGYCYCWGEGCSCRPSYYFSVTEKEAP